MITTIIDWIDERTKIRSIWDFITNRPIPGGPQPGRPSGQRFHAPVPQRGLAGLLDQRRGLR